MIFPHKLTLFFAILALTIMSAAGQQPVKNYETSWKKVEAVLGKGLPESALKEVKQIHILAKSEKQDAQVIKSLISILNLQNELSEDEEFISINDAEKQIAEIESGVWKGSNPKETSIAILKSFLAGMYHQYFQQNRWQLYERTNTSNFIKTDIATWNAQDFHKQISELFLASLNHETALKETKLENFDAIIIKGNVRHLRPTLFDLLAHRAIDYFGNVERDLIKPAYAFQINHPEAFAPATDFVKVKFTTRDSLSLEHKALLIYQRLLAFHLKDINPSALVDADLARIEFVNKRSVHTDKAALYTQALIQIAETYRDLPAASQAWFLLAQDHYNKGATYKPFGDTTFRHSKLKAQEILQMILKQKDSSEGKVNAHNLLNTINNKDLQFQVEKVNVPGIPFRMLVEYTNINKLYFRVIKNTDKIKEVLVTATQPVYWSRMMAETPVRSWTQELPLTQDLQRHSVEIKVDDLPVGDYMILASSDPEFNGKNAVSGARAFFVSNISFVNNGNDYFVLHRETGQPLSNAVVQLWEQKYDYKTSKYSKVKKALYTADKNGFFQIKEEKSPDNYRSPSSLIDITYGQDRLFLDEQVYNPYYYNREEQNKDITSIFFFTDRSIYRPGQTVFFKGIVLNKNAGEKASNVKASYKTTVLLRNANGEQVDSIAVTTNEFGSFNGKFQLPQSGLNGAFSIITEKDGGYAGFQVEDYKRPKFYVEYEKIKGIYKVNDSITVTGVAKAYAGNNIDGAQVKYRVVRQPRFLYPWMFSRMWMPPVQEMEITNGEVKTDKDGKFIITFKAIPDLSINKKLDPVFDYRVYADVTDINGETRSGEKEVSVSYKSLVLVTNVPAVISADSLKNISISTQNMNGDFESAVVKVTISELGSEKRLIRERFWERPDQYVMTKEEYIKNFPHDEYSNEKDPGKWEIRKTVYSVSDSSKSDGVWKLEAGKYPPGHYVIEIEVIGKNAEVTKDKKYIELIDEKSGKLNTPKYITVNPKKTTVQPGEQAVVEAGTSADNLFVVQSINRIALNSREGKTDYSFVKLDEEKKTFTFPVTESDLGGFGTAWVFVKHNRVYTSQVPINVPWSNKELKMEFLTYRDKALPGSKESWSIKISGNKNEKVAAEMLASMYDASLDQFTYHSWNKPDVWPIYSTYQSWSGATNFTKVVSNLRIRPERNYKPLRKTYDQLLFPINYRDSRVYMHRESMVMDSSMPAEWSAEGKGIQGKVPGVDIQNANAVTVQIRGNSSIAGNPLYIIDGVISTSAEGLNLSPDNILSINVLKGQEAIALYGSKASEGAIIITTTSGGKKPEQEITTRKNFNETAFFFPELRTDSTGAIEFSFTLPEALTKWKFMALAHTKDAAFAYSTKEIITQKELMVQPNAPRFLREGDKMEFSTKIVNLTNKELTGQAELKLYDATTNQPVDGWFHNMMPNQYFTVAAGQSESVEFPIEVPYLFNKALVWKIIARSDVHSDGEENTLPVLTNRTLVTETITLPMRGDGTKNFTFDKLLNSGQSTTLQHHALTVEYTSNPAWYAVQALPYLMEYPYDCAEQTWNRYYANSLASHILRSSPRIKMIFDQWKTKDTAALLSNLQKNQELKAVLLEETPWVLAAKTESEQKKNIALLFDMIKMKDQLNASYDKLKKMQSSNGGFVWFTGGPDDRYMTQYIVSGIGHLMKLKAITDGQEEKLGEILEDAIPYLDRKMKEDYDELVKNKAVLSQQHISYIHVQYLYMRSFFPEYKITENATTAYNYFRKQAQQFWVKQSKYMQGMTALALSRTGDAATPAMILKSLKETAIKNDEMGMYWKDQRRGWFWYEAPIETQALLIEAFYEIGKDTKTVDDLRTWLLKNKQTNNWESTKATAEACYALLLQGSDWLKNEPTVTIKAGTTTISSTDIPAEAGTGYFKQPIAGEKVKPDMGNISVTVSSTNNNSSATWGGVYWQYFEDLDKITKAVTPLSISKKLFTEKNSDRGPVLNPINDGDVLKVGDKITVRVELRVDRDMEYVHMKDMRASALEPVNVISGYKYQGGLGYYESTRDASTNFFFNYLRKGTYVFEYTLFVTHTGNFSNGITTIQCMYAPEFTSHSEGVRISVE